MTQNKRKNMGFVASTLAFILIVFLLIISFAVLPLLALLVGMGFGYVLEAFTGDYVVQAFNALGLTNVREDDLPKVFGLLTLITAILGVAFVGANKSKGDDKC